jgi:LysM repeat protein/lysophospholipase L1-like esterase
MLVAQGCSQTDTLNKVISKNERYPWLMPAYNYIQFYNRSALDRFINSWSAGSYQKLSIVHFGDSHLQSDIFPGRLRKLLHQKHGDGGRGLIFPFSTVKTYSSWEYQTAHTGKWQAQRSITLVPKLSMGVRGMTCRTEQLPASFVFHFRDSVPTHYNRLRLFCRFGPESYDIVLKINKEQIPVMISAIDSTQYWLDVTIPPLLTNELKVEVVRSCKEQKYFECYGLSLETSQSKGAVLHNAGVGAARASAILYQPRTAKELPAFDPDVIIIDYGTNDYLYDDVIKPELESEIKSVIAIIRNAVPQASIILTTTQDLFYKKKNCKSGEAFADLIHKIAKETNCGVYDWYWVSGAQHAMKHWVEARIAQPDYVHLTIAGYQLKGDLFYQAMVATIDTIRKSDFMNQLVLSVDSLRPAQKQLRDSISRVEARYSYHTRNRIIHSNTPVITNETNAAGQQKLIYSVRPGESLYVIGRRYKVTVNQLMAWNNLRTSRLQIGQKLVIWIRK